MATPPSDQKKNTNPALMLTVHHESITSLQRVNGLITETHQLRGIYLNNLNLTNEVFLSQARAIHLPDEASEEANLAKRDTITLLEKNAELLNDLATNLLPGLNPFIPEHEETDKFEDLLQKRSLAHQSLDTQEAIKNALRTTYNLFSTKHVEMLGPPTTSLSLETVRELNLSCVTLHGKIKAIFLQFYPPVREHTLRGRFAVETKLRFLVGDFCHAKSTGDRQLLVNAQTSLEEWA